MVECKTCNVILVEDQNWYSSCKKSSAFFCKTCWKSKTNKHYESNKSRRYELHKEWKKNNKDRWKSIVKKHNYKVKDKREIQNQKLYQSLGAGVYGFMYKGEWLYVGESNKMYRRWKDHLTGNPNRSPISLLIFNNDIDKELLEFFIIEQVDDRNIRKDRETFWINELLPLLNKDKINLTKLIK